VGPERPVSPGWALLSGVVRNIDLILAGAILVPAIVLLLLTLKGPQFVAHSMIAPQAQVTTSRLGALAMQMGVGGAGAGDESPHYYQRLLVSHNVLVDVGRQIVEVQTVDGTRSASLAELFGVPADAEPVAAVRALRGQIHVSAEWDAGLVRVQTTAGSLQLAELLNTLLLARAEVHNGELRRRAAGAERMFVEARLQETQHELEAAEQELERFLIANREYRNAPSLTFEASRLQRRIDTRQQVVGSLTESLENARIDEVRSTPLFRMVEHPEGTATQRPSTVLVMFSVVFGLMLGAGAGYIREQMQEHGRRETLEWKTFTRSIGTAARRVKVGGPTQLPRTRHRPADDQAI
jgi:uncharacterized protein involved in exopolysaccharide biosynthesis